MRREIKKYLFDVKISIDSINEYLGENMTFLNFRTISYFVGELNGKLRSLGKQ